MHIHIYVLFFIFYSIICYYKTLSVIPCATIDLAVYLFYILKIFVSANPKLLIYPLLPSPLVNVSLFSRFVSLFLFCKQVHFYHLFRFQMQVISYGICQKLIFYKYTSMLHKITFFPTICHVLSQFFINEVHSMYYPSPSLHLLSGHPIFSHWPHHVRDKMESPNDK